MVVARNLVYRADGKLVNVARKQGQLFVCVNGCCCGQTDRGFAAVPTDLYHEEWERRRLRNKVHFTQAGCLGPCPLANVAMLLFDERHIWFHSLNAPEQVLAVYDYIDAMLAANAYLAPPPALAPHTFTSFTWDGPESERHQPRRPEERPAVLRDGILFLSQADTDLLLLSHLPPVPAVESLRRSRGWDPVPPPPPAGMRSAHLEGEGGRTWRAGAEDEAGQSAAVPGSGRSGVVRRYALEDTSLTEADNAHHPQRDSSTEPSRDVPLPSQGSGQGIGVAEVQALMWERAGLVRDAAGLTQASETLAGWQRAQPAPATRAEHELANLLLVGRLVVAAAALRRESRGAHYRSDYPTPAAGIPRHTIFQAAATPTEELTNVAAD